MAPRDAIAAIFAPLYERALQEAESILEESAILEAHDESTLAHLLTFPIAEGL